MTFDPMNMLNSALVSAALMLTPAVAPSTQASTMPEIAFSSQMIEGLTIAYREAGDPRNPTVLLLHGFPSSSYMFRDLIPVLAQEYHVIAPDYPGFGASDMPLAAEYDYSFANTADLVTQLLDQKGVGTYAVYMTDYGAPVGFRMFAEDPARVSGFIIQNANAYEEGLREFWGPMRAYWADPSPENGDALRGFLTLDATKWQFTHGAEDPASVSPDHFWHAQYLLDRPGNQEVQLEMFLDYGKNLGEYPKWQALFREHQPPALLVWGANDQICPEEGAYPYKRDLTDLEFHLLNTGHFALQEKGPEIAGKMLSFLDRINN